MRKTRDEKEEDPVKLKEAISSYCTRDDERLAKLEHIVQLKIVLKDGQMAKLNLEKEEKRRREVVEAEKRKRKLRRPKEKRKRKPEKKRRKKGERKMKAKDEKRRPK